MKKIFFVAIAAVALVFTGCKNETPAPVVDEEPVAEEVNEFTVDSLATLINAETPDTAAISSFMTGVQSQIESLKSIDPTKAQEYLAQVQQFLKILIDAGISATRRREMGDDIEGACGQLRRKTIITAGGEYKDAQI